MDWIKNYLWMALLQTGQEHPSETSATSGINHLAWRLGWGPGAHFPFPALLLSYLCCISIMENTSEIHWFIYLFIFSGLRFFRDFSDCSWMQVCKHPETSWSGPWKAISASAIPRHIAGRSQTHSSSFTINGRHNPTFYLTYLSRPDFVLFLYHG